MRKAVAVCRQYVRYLKAKTKCGHDLNRKSKQVQQGTKNLLLVEELRQAEGV